MDTNWNQLIERYLNNELSAEGKAGFEVELAKNPELKQEFELHQLTRDVIKRASTRNLVQQSAKRYHYRKTITTTGVIVLAAAVAAFILFLKIHVGVAPEDVNAPELIEQTLLQKMNKDLQFENIDAQYFKFTGEDDVFLSESGVLLSITDKSFLLNGKPYSGEAVVQWQEAQQASDIIKAGLSTLTGDKLLETQGMFSLNAFTPEGKQLQLSNTGIYVQVPVDELKKDMMLFNGVQEKNGTIDWQTPIEMERLPKPKSMAKMDLFPPKYEPKLNELKWFTNKAKRDSLYLSFDETLARDTFFSVENDGQDLFNDIPKPAKAFGNSTGKNVDLGGAQLISMVTLPPFQDTTWKANALGASYQQSERAQDKVKWNFSLEKIAGTNDAWIVARVSIEKGWHINAVNLPKGSFGSATAINFDKSANYELLGKIVESTPKNTYDQEADEHISCHEGNVIFKQKIRINGAPNSEVSVSYTYQACSPISEQRLVQEFSNDKVGKPIKTNDKTGYCLPPYTGHAIIFLDSKEAKNHIPPSKVLAIWDKKFDHTILATQDFEDRMKMIHNTCDERVFDVYVNNLNEPLWKLDEQVVKMGYPEFQKFADQKVGAIKVKDGHQKNLQIFYDQAILKLQSKGRDALLADLKKQDDWNQTMQEERTAEAYRKGTRAVLSKSDEADFNLKHLSKQLGPTLAFRLTNQTFPPAASNTIQARPGSFADPGKSNDANFQQSITGFKNSLPMVINIDRLTPQLLSSRESVTVKLLDKSKSAEVLYSACTMNLDSPKQFEKLYFYLLPEEVNSFERLDFTNGLLSYNLNDAMNYKGVVVGINESGYFLHEFKSLKSGNHGQIALVEVSEAEFTKRINALNKNRNSKPMEIQSELNWLFKEKTNYKVQKQRKKDAEFRAVVRPTIYACSDRSNLYIPTVSQLRAAGASGTATFSTEPPLAIQEVVEDPASYAGGRTALLEFLNLNLKYPQRAIDNNITGKVYLKFVVSETGKISNVTVTRKLPGCPECDEEAKRVVEMMPDWIPAKTGLSNVSSYFNLPISFSLK